MADEPFAASAEQLGEEEQLVRRYLEEARKAHRCWTGSTPSRLQAGGLLTSQCGDVTGRRRSPPPWEAAVQAFTHPLGSFSLHVYFTLPCYRFTFTVLPAPEF